MTDLTQKWPLGLGKRTWPLYCLGLVLVLGALVPFDISLAQWVTAWPKDVIGFFELITDYGKSDWMLIPSLSVLLIAYLVCRLAKRRLNKLAAWQVFGVASFIFVGVGLPGLVANLLKRVIGRGRPLLFDQIGAFDFQYFAEDWRNQGFPSGHATTAIGLAFVIGFLAPRYFRVFLAIALAVAVSRVAVGAHYPTDVVAGTALGLIGAYAVRNLFASRRFVFERQGRDRVVLRPLSALRRALRRRQRPR